MASIPLVALSARPPADMAQGLGNMAQLANMIQMAPLKRQLTEQAVQQGQQENELRQQQITSQKALMKAYQDANGDLDKASSLAAKYGAMPKDVLSLKQASIAQQKSNIDLLNAKGSRALQEADLWLGAHTAVDKAPPEQRPAIYQQQLQGLQQAGVDVSQAPPQYPGDEAFKIIGLGLQSHKTQLANLAQEATTRKTTAEAAKLEAETNAANPADPNLQKAKYQGILQKVQQGGISSLSPQDLQWAKAFEASQQKTTTSSDSLGINTVSTSRPSGLSGGGSVKASPGGLTQTGSTMVDEIGTGKMALGRLDYILARKPQILQAVAAKYPDFDSSKVKSYIDAYKDFTSGKSSIQINAGAVALQHLQQLKKINDDNPTESRIPGTAAYKAFHNLLDTVTDELVTFYGEPKTNEAIGSKKATLGGLTNRDAAIVEQAKAMGIRLDELEQRWKNAAPSSSYQAPLPGISKAAQNARASLDPEYAAQSGIKQQPVSTNKGPAVGAVEDGYKFKGGNPADPKNWEKVK